MTDNAKSAAEMAVEIKAAFETKHDAVKAIAEKALAEAEKGTPLSTTAKELADEAILGMNEAKARLDELEQKMARKTTEGNDKPKSPGYQFIESDSYKNLAGSASQRGTASIEVKDITSLSTDADGSAGDMIRGDRLVDITPLPRRRMTVRSLLGSGRTNSNSVEYVRQTGYTNAAAIQAAEGDLKAESTMKFDLFTAPVRTIAHYIKASKQVLDDAPQLQSIIDSDMRYGLEYAEEVQILNGNGTGANINGLINQATAYAAPFDPAGTETGIDLIRLALLQSTLALLPASGIVMSEQDWARIELLKDADGRYLIGNPQGTIGANLWGLPVVATPAIAVDKFLVGAFASAAMVLDREMANVQVSTENEDDFIRNMVTIRAEERLALVVRRPQAFIYGDFGNVA
ncbi:MAG: phage major capsid protein [Pseudomonadota bacterium]